MTEIMDDYDAGYSAGKKYAQDKVLELMDEVIEVYRDQYVIAPGNEQRDRKNAVEFMKSWVITGGHEDFDGNRACLPW